jgi:hypothetical protein
MKINVASIAAGSLFVLGGAFMIGAALSSPALATEQFAKDTGKSCAACHVAAAGGGPLTPYGVKFQANGNKAPAAPK